MSGHPSWYDIGCAVLGVTMGARLLFFTQRTLQASQKAHRARVQERLARGTDAYFEELRSIEAYPPIDRPGRARFIGAALIALCGGYLVYLLFVQGA